MMSVRWCRSAALLLACLTLAGCTSEPPIGDYTPSPPQDPSTMSSDELYNLAVQQYQKVFDLYVKLDQNGGTAILPNESHAYLMAPAWNDINKYFSTMFINGYHLDGPQTVKITAISSYISDDPPDGTLISIQTCEKSEGAKLVNRDGEAITDGKPTLINRHGFFKIDSDGRLKLFWLSSTVEESCSIE